MQKSLMKVLDCKNKKDLVLKRLRTGALLGQSLELSFIRADAFMTYVVHNVHWDPGRTGRWRGYVFINYYLKSNDIL